MFIGTITLAASSLFAGEYEIDSIDLQDAKPRGRVTRLVGERGRELGADAGRALRDECRVRLVGDASAARLADVEALRLSAARGRDGDRAREGRALRIAVREIRAQPAALGARDRQRVVLYRQDSDVRGLLARVLELDSRIDGRARRERHGSGP